MLTLTTTLCCHQVQQPVNFTTLSDRYSAFATEFIGNTTNDPRPFFLCECGTGRLGAWLLRRL